MQTEQRQRYRTWQQFYDNQGGKDPLGLGGRVCRFKTAVSCL